MRSFPASLVALFVSLALTADAVAAMTPGMSLFGDLKYGPDFQHFYYANPDAPKGGTMRLFAIGTFDTLAVASEDEPSSEYGLVAETIELAPDKLSVLYTLRKDARFHDGTPMTP